MHGSKGAFVLAWTIDLPATIHSFQKNNLMAYIVRCNVSFLGKEIVDWTYTFHNVRSDVSGGFRHP